MPRLIYLVLFCLMALNVEAQGLRLPTRRQHSTAPAVRVIVKKPAPQRKVVVNSMPAWNPGMNHGKPANVWFTLPITFKLQ